ncbi:MAG: NlpC/P60 family protein [Bacteroidales bacterium]|nr:NlpC/P60 family protein [Bacteroidales bacterium]MDD4669574.1 NlpC/P60 family protein [Bacteroidales bacterium]
MKKPLFLAIATLLIICSCDSNDFSKAFETVSKEVKSEFAPDSRVKTFEAEIEKVGENLVLRGVTTEKEAKDALLSKLAENKIDILDSMVLLPHPELGDKTYGITNLSVINIRMKPGYDEESGTQTLLGTPLQILEKRGGWLRVVSPEGYIAWVTSGSVAAVTKEEAQVWRDAPKVVVNTYYTILRSQPSDNATVVCDAVWGCIVTKLSEQGKYYKVLLPNGKEAYLLKEHSQDFTQWLDSRKPTPEKIIATAKQFLGFPYMWGGTSVKGMDCSGFTKTTYYLNGIILQRDASQQVYTGDDVDITNGLDNLKMGDLIFFGRKATETQKERATHVGIYIGNGEFIHCATSVRINSLIPEADNYYEGSVRLIRARRILGNEDADKGITSIKHHPWYFKTIE